jgi:hypothetical protein
VVSLSAATRKPPEPNVCQAFTPFSDELSAYTASM